MELVGLFIVWMILYGVYYFLTRYVGLEKRREYMARLRFL